MARTKNREANGPQFIRFFKPIIQTLREMGGSSTSAEVTNAVIERLNIPEDEQAVVNQKSGQNRIYNQVHWARLYLVNGGLIDSSRRGVWTLTDRGNSIDVDHDLDPLVFYKDVHKNLGARSLKREMKPLIVMVPKKWNPMTRSQRILITFLLFSILFHLQALNDCANDCSVSMGLRM